MDPSHTPLFVRALATPRFAVATNVGFFTSRLIHSVVNHAARNLPFIELFLKASNLLQASCIPDQLLDLLALLIRKFDSRYPIAAGLGGCCSQGS